MKFLASFLSIFRSKKKAEEKETKNPERTLLDDLCGDDCELKDIPSRTLLLNPTIAVHGGGIESHVTKAQEYENNQDYLKARIEYQIAGQLALYEGKLDEVQKWFKKAMEVDSDSPYRNVFQFFAETTNAARALSIAQQYYAHKKPSGLEHRNSVGLMI